MRKLKRKGKPNRRRLIIAVLLLLFGVCGFVGFQVANFIVYINQEPYFDNELLRDIEITYSPADLSRVEAIVQEYVTVGESTRAEVESFGNEYLDDPYNSCHVSDFVTNAANQTCYYVARYPAFPCAERSIAIYFAFEDDILAEINLYEHQICL